MKILIADDNTTNRKLVKALLTIRGHQVLEAPDGKQALAILSAADAPSLAILDWEMPEMEGIEVCRQVRQFQGAPFKYLLLLTVRDQKSDIVNGLEAGADDYITKPFDSKELLARVQIGVRMVDLNVALSDRVRQLEVALAQIKQLHGMLPICSYCKKIRDDKNYWQQVEKYFSDHSGATFTHGICPDCYERLVKNKKTV